MKTKWLIAIMVILTLITVGILYYILNTNGTISHLPVDDNEYKVLQNVVKEDTTIDDEMFNSIKGKSVLEGGPYRLGETIFAQGVGVKVEKVGWRDEIKWEGYETDLPEEYGHAVFKLTVYNLNIQPYIFSGEDMILIHDVNNNTVVHQSLKHSGYDLWKYLDGSYDVGQISSKTYRTGYVFFPVKDIAKQGGKIKIFINDIPVEFKY